MRLIYIRVEETVGDVRCVGQVAITPFQLDTKGYSMRRAILSVEYERAKKLCDQEVDPVRKAGPAPGALP